MAAEVGQPQKADSILVVSLDNLGDLVFASALLAPIRKHFPSARIGLWCKEYSSGLAPLLPQVDELYAADPFWDRAPNSSKGSLRRFVASISAVRRAQFDTAILFSAQWRVAAAVAASRIPQRIGLERRRNRRWLTDTLPPEDHSKPVLEEVSRLLWPLGIRGLPLRYRLDATRLTGEHKLVVKKVGDSPYAALHPFAGSEHRCVKLDEWIKVADELSLRGMRTFWVGTANELANVRSRAEAKASWRYSDELSNGSLTTVAVGISRARIFIGHDSGPMHIASALGVPTIGVFAPGEPRRTFPQGGDAWRIISRESPLEVGARDILEEVSVLLD